MQARETSMKEVMLRGTIVSFLGGLVSGGYEWEGEGGEGEREGVDGGREMMGLHVKSSDMEKSRMYLKRMSVAMQALLHTFVSNPSSHPSIQTDTVLPLARESRSRLSGKRKEREEQTHNDPSPIVTPAATFVLRSISNRLKMKTGTIAMMISVAAEKALRTYTEII